MTTNKPRIEAYLVTRIKGEGYGKPRKVLDAKVYNPTSDSFFVKGAKEKHTVEPLVALSDYEALQAELAELKQTPLFTAGYRFGRDANDAGHTVRLQKEKDALQAECDALRDKTRLTLGVGDGTGNLFVHGDYDSIKRVQELIFECEKLRKDAEFGRSVLSKREPGKVYGCHCDLEEGMEPDGCVIDEGSPHQCVYAKHISTKEQCKYWQEVTS